MFAVLFDDFDCYLSGLKYWKSIYLRVDLWNKVSVHERNTRAYWSKSGTIEDDENVEDFNANDDVRLKRLESVLSTELNILR